MHKTTSTMDQICETCYEKAIEVIQEYGPQFTKARQIIKDSLHSEPNKDGNIVCDLTSLKNLYKVPPIPEGIHELIVRSMRITKSFSSLPVSLKKIDARHSGFTMIPDLSANPNIISIEFDKCPITQLESIPSTLHEFSISECVNIKSIPPLPHNLKKLYVSSLPIKVLPELPDSLVHLDADECRYLSHLPSKLPSNLEVLYVSYTSISELPPLPDSLLHLDCADTEVDSLPPLPNKIVFIKYTGSIFPETWPESVEELDLHSSRAKEIKTLPPKLDNLRITYSDIKKIPDFPPTMQYFYARNTHITKVPELPQGMKELFVCGSKPFNIPAIPKSIENMELNSMSSFKFCLDKKNKTIDEDGSVHLNVLPQVSMNFAIEVKDGKVVRDTVGVLEDWPKDSTYSNTVYSNSDSESDSDSDSYSDSNSDQDKSKPTP